MLDLFLHSIDQLDELPAKAAFLFGPNLFGSNPFGSNQDADAEAAHADPENAALLATDQSRKVLAAFAQRTEAHTGPVTPELFREWMNAIKAETGVKGKDLFHPVRIALTGMHSGPEFDKLLPVIEHGAELPLPRPVPNVRERIEQFTTRLAHDRI